MYGRYKRMPHQSKMADNPCKNASGTRTVYNERIKRIGRRPFNARYSAPIYRLNFKGISITSRAQSARKRKGTAVDACAEIFGKITKRATKTKLISQKHNRNFHVPRSRIGGFYVSDFSSPSPASVSVSTAVSVTFFTAVFIGKLAPFPAFLSKACSQSYPK